MLPSLRAAFDLTVRSGEFFSSLKMKQMRGYPERIALPEQALNEAAQQKLWHLSEEMAHTHFTWGSPTKMANSAS